MRIKNILPAALSSLMLVTACEQIIPVPDLTKYSGLIMNEIAAHDQDEEFDTWVELVNTSDKDVELDGLSFYVTDTYFKGQNIGSLSGKLGPGERLVVSTEDGGLKTGIASDAPFTLTLGLDSENSIDSYEHVEGERPLGYFASFQRIPDLSTSWKHVTYSSPGAPNEIFDISKTRPTAIWAWGSHLSDLVENDGAKMRELKNKGYDHILMSYAGFDKKNYRNQAIRFIYLAREIGITVHVWLQAFYNGSWISPIDDEKKAYKEEVFARIREEAEFYLENWGVQGVHLDYIRFGGTASKHNWSSEVNSVGAVNRCCREVREICDSFDEGLVTSAALMPEANSSQYYAQVPAQMAKYIHILMPMNYRYGSYNMSDGTFKGNSDYYQKHAVDGGGVCWTGIQTYDANTKGMSAEALRKDIDLIAETTAAGVVLFRYGLGTFPDIKDLYK